MKARILVGDVRTRLSEIPDQSVQSCVTSPPYFGLRDYGEDAQIGLEPSLQDYVDEIVKVFREVKRVLRDDGTLWLNLGDSYSGSGKGRNPDGTVHVSALIAKQGTSAGTVMGDVPSGIVPEGLKPKDLMGVPWRVAFALQADGWYLRQDIIWAKPNPMPESVTDRCTKSHEYLFLLSKSARYYFDNQAIKEPAVWAGDERNGEGRLTYDGKRQGQKGEGQEAFVSISDTRNKRDVWTINTKPFKGAHFAVMPEALVEPCILAGSKEGDTILDPFSGSGTVGLVALTNNREYLGVELNPQYAEMSVERIGLGAELEQVWGIGVRA